VTVITDKKSFRKAIPILASDKAHLPKLLAKLTPVQRRWAETAGFDAAPNTHAIVPDEKGGAAMVLAGVRDAGDVWALASLPLKLPAGRYELGKGPVTVPADNAAYSWNLGSYKFAKYRKAGRVPAELQVEESAKVTLALQCAEAQRLVRDLVNTPTEDMGPEHLAKAAREQAQLFGGKYREWVGDQLLAENFPAIHAVGRAAAPDRQPRLIEITWGNPKNPKIAVVGKGVCFDTGGLDIKTAEGMRLMKKDMGGAAHALALARLIMQRKLPYRLQMLIPAVENNIGSNSYRPGDVIKTRAGHHIEIGNTDAEGRVVLCDALTFAVEQKPKLVIDFATLTGAARVALGPELPALFSNDEKLAARLEKSSVALDDPMWRMPLWRNYRRFFDSDIADFNNSGRAGFAGAIVGALFLDYFVPSDVSWAHFDVYSWNDVSRPGRPLGGEMQGLRAVLASIS